MKLEFENNVDCADVFVVSSPAEAVTSSDVARVVAQPNTIKVLFVTSV